MSNVSSSNSQGVCVPKLRFPGFEGEWEHYRLGDIVTVGNGMDYKKLEKGDIPVYGTGGYMLSVDKALSYDKDAIGIGRKGTIDKPYILKAPFWTVDTLFYCIPKDDFNLDFLYGIFQKINWKRKDESTGVPSLSKTNINLTVIAVPSIKEQKQIADLLTLIDNKIEKQRQLVELLKSYKRGVSNRIFRGMSDPSWHTICLGEICSITMGQSPDSNSYNTDGIGLPLVQGNADITNGLTTPLRYTSNPTKVCENGSVILSVRAPVGTVSRANQRVCLGRGVCAIASSNTDFIYQLLLCYQDSWKRIEQGGTFAAISGDDISSFSVEIPDCELQNRIAVFLSQFDTKIRNEEKILLELQKQKAALLQQLFI